MMVLVGSGTRAYAETTLGGGGASGDPPPPAL